MGWSHSGTGSGDRTPRRKPFSAVPNLCLSLWILFLYLPGAYQQCSAGDGSVSVISDAASLSMLASSTQRTWDFQSLPAPPTALANQSADVNLTCITATNVALGPPTRAQFLSPLAIGLTGSSTLKVQDSVLSTDCDTLYSFQTYLCSTYATAGSLSVYQGAIYITQWSDNRTALRRVNITCPNSQTAAPPPCHLTAVSTAAELLAAFTVYTAALSALSNATIIISSNISVSNSTWPRPPVEVTRNTTLRGTSLLSRPVLDFNLLVNMWHIPPDMIVVLENLTLANLAPAYFTPTLVFSQFGILTERVWAFERYDRQLFIQDCTMAIPREELNYIRYWFVFLLSSDPDARARADWLQVFDLEPPIVNGTGVYLTVMRSFTTEYFNVLLTDTLGGTYPLLPQNLGLAQLQNSGVPLTAVHLVNSSTDFVAGLWPNNSTPDSAGWRYVFLVENVTLGDAAWFDAVAALNGSAMINATTGAVNVPGNLIIGHGSGFEVLRLGWGGEVALLRVPSNASLTLRDLILSGLGPRAAPGGYNASLPLAVLAAPLWGLSPAPGPRRLMLDNCTVLVTEDELAVLLEVLVPLGQGSLTNISGDGSTWTTGAPAALRNGISTFFSADALELGSYHAGMLEVKTGATTRFSMRNVVFRLPDTTVGEEAPSPGLRALGVPFGAATGGSGSSFPGWAIAVIVVGSCLLLLLTGFVFYRWRRARQGEDLAYEKYLKRTADQAGGAAGSDTGTGTGLGGATPPRHPSQELTTSSQVLRPGARASDPELGLRIGPFKGCLPGLSQSPSNTGVVGAASASQPTSSRGGGTSSLAMNTLPATLPGLQGHAGQDSQLPFPLPLSERAQAELAVNLGSAVGLTDSFDRPPTSTALGQHGAFGRVVGASGPNARSSENARASSVVTPQGAQLLNTAMSTASASLLASAAAPVDQMHQMIATMGREFGNDKQLVVHSVLGKGAHGTVYLGTWRGLQVAVKSMILRQEDQRHQHRPLMEAAISSNLAHRNIVTTYAYELRELEHEFASISPELARQGGGWRLLIIQEFCDGGPARSLVDCGYFHTPSPLSKHSPPPQQQPGRSAKVKKSGVGSLLMRMTDSNQASGGNAGATVDAAPVPEGFPHNAPAPPRRASSSGSSGNSAAGSSGRGNGGGDAAASPQQQQPGQGHGRTPAMDNPPSSMPPRPGSSLEAALRYVEASLQVACGLQHIHAKNIVHGDLNTNNVLVSRAPGTRLGYVLKVADFGLSVRMQEGESHLSNLFQGSPYYVAPEVVLSGKVGKAADTFSLGIIMWELAHGQRPPWRRGTRLRTYPSLNTSELEFAPEVPPRFARLTRDCFHASKDARPSMEQVVDTLTGIKEELEALRSKG